MGEKNPKQMMMLSCPLFADITSLMSVECRDKTAHPRFQSVSHDTLDRERKAVADYDFLRRHPITSKLVDESRKSDKEQDGPRYRWRFSRQKAKESSRRTPLVRKASVLFIDRMNV